MKLCNCFLWLYSVLVTQKSTHIKAQKGKMSECDIAYLHIYLPLFYLYYNIFVCVVCYGYVGFSIAWKIAAIEHGY